MRASEIIIKTKRKSSAVKLQSAWEKQQAKSTASRKRGEEYMAKIKQDIAKKNQGVEEAFPNQQMSLYNPNGKTYRTDKKMPTLDPNDPVHNADRYGQEHDEPYQQDFNREEIKRLVKQHLDELNDRQKQVLKLMYWEEMTLEEIAVELKVTRERVRQIWARAMRMLRQNMKSKNYDFDMSEDWQKVNRHDKTDGLSKKAVSAYRREHPGSKLKTAVTTKPSKLKKGSKSAKRRASFCARMSGMKKHRTGAKTKRDPDSNINKALRRWHCESIEEMQELIMIGEQYISQLRESATGGATSSGSVASVAMPLGGKKKKKGGGVNLLGGPVFKR